MPAWCLVSFLSLPFAIKAMRGSMHYKDRDTLMIAMQNNVNFIMLTHILLGIGYILAGLM